MSAEEVEAVLGHEVSHVANGDMVTLSLLGRANLVVGLYDPVSGTRLLGQNGRDFIPLESEIVISSNE